MKKLCELNISPSPWRVCVDKFGTVQGIEDSNKRGIVETDSGVYPPELNDAQMMATAPALYAAGYWLLWFINDWMNKYPPCELSKMGISWQLLCEAKVAMAYALNEAARESEVVK